MSPGTPPVQDDRPDDNQGESEYVAQTVLVGEEHLRVHYRARSQSLIQFSNHQFYKESPLIVFPDASPALSSSCVRDVYVPDGRYDGARTRTNQVEAEKVVDTVFHLMETIPEGESIGVAALSRAQADCIAELIDVKRVKARHLDSRFAEGGTEPFFVKNLENVQGDERDHMVLSIGYGPLVSGGAVPNRFGPINREGGDRRLNVLVGRARRSMTVVHSLRPTDIRSEQAGARLLREFLEYVGDPVDFFVKRGLVDPDAEPESPFEEAVFRELTRRGYKVRCQVGVAGYRIDLVVMSEDEQQFDLGIECDGWTYHISPAARDRGWLRQSVLEDLGWTIHRVWSTAWVRDPEAEIAAIDRAISRVRGREHRFPEWSRES